MTRRDITWEDSGFDCDHCGGEILKRSHQTIPEREQYFQCNQCGCRWSVGGDIIRVGSGPFCQHDGQQRPYLPTDKRIWCGCGHSCPIVYPVPVLLRGHVYLSSFSHTLRHPHSHWHGHLLDWPSTRFLGIAMKRWLPALLWMIAIFTVSHQPSTGLPNFGFLDLLVKKGGHFLAYAILAVLVQRAWRPGSASWGWALLITAVYASSDESTKHIFRGVSAPWPMS